MMVNGRPLRQNQLLERVQPPKTRFGPAMESGVAEHVGPHERGAHIMADIVVRVSVIASGVKRVLEGRDAGICDQNPEGQIGHSTVGNIVERMAQV
jgi:hypothetical protein